MSILLPPSNRSGAAVRAVVQERKFRLILDCLECKHPHRLEFSLFDEPDDPATRHDFYESGVMDHIQFRCERCGHEYASYTEVAFVEEATTVRIDGGDNG